ncbi:acyltransferase family protein [Alteromonas mediterranea]|uniref:acyltransferase family protein n=1 Tax=Alteromonas mediterranea TaxID=314275 RepID=UPI0009BD40DA
MRVIAILAVIIIHTKPFFLAGNSNIGIFLHQVYRFAVPFFFVISGYFLQQE